MTTLVSNRMFGVIAAALALTACAQTESPRPRLLAASEARISAIDPAMLTDGVVAPFAIQRNTGLLLVSCSIAPPSDRPRLIDSTTCSASIADAPRIL